VDNKNIQENLNGWNMNIGYIPQNIYLTDDSIKNNIAFGLEEEGIDENRLNQALKEAQLQEMVETLPRGTDTIIGEHGTRISGGQRQRLGIARALYNQPELLIMDEATSSLDSITEKFIIESIEMLKSHRTIIMIAHRLTTVKNADIIYFMKNGRIYDSGTYDELLEKNKEFKALAGMS
ncbi:MAG: ATP-binding cassette domain-containing protein, partial [Bacteroidota bacterium]